MTKLLSNEEISNSLAALVLSQRRVTITLPDTIWMRVVIGEKNVITLERIDRDRHCGECEQDKLLTPQFWKPKKQKGHIVGYDYPCRECKQKSKVKQEPFMVASSVAKLLGGK